ncbi:MULTISPECIES: Rne/Rng family ribonuclease [Rhodomicrobium]|uniref:Rne/Rng family ribonuclease n=1 Tax=Rhodomicrobium TaxID=1068 RepID=UPI000B4AB7D3|nr:MULTISPECIES: Rne/Rng family ribonuclease [Rhodomicrobium]
MGNKMLIDATHPEETRVVVLRGHRVEEFDFESASRKQLRGNIYLAKVTRVEPSLQAAFVNYGGNRHGFLAFNEIHPDYYQLPMAERQALKREEERDTRADSAAYEDGAGHSASHEHEAGAAPQGEETHEAGGHHHHDGHHDHHHHHHHDEGLGDDEADPRQQTAALEAALPAAKYSGDLYDESRSEQPDLQNWPESNVETISADHDDDGDGDRDDDAEDAPAAFKPKRHGRRDRNGNGAEEGVDLDHVESVGSEDALEELPQRNRRRRRIYKIQEVIKRGQIILVQVVKEERGNKGAALTTYLSLAGRYTVLMPNTGSGGGISRKISSPGDRKRLREIAGELDVPDGMGLIIRTAGAARTKTEIKRDYEYLLRLWENVRDLTLKSTAPALVYEEGDLIKRSIRDLYNREIDEVLVAGDDAYRDAKDFMRMLMPSHAKNVQPYKDPEPIFARYEVERQLNAMFSPQVTLPSGGYIIINQTEALVAIDINSGKSTREFSIEETALKTNMEAAEEIARQLRLRDLAGLIVADFIDMEEKRNNRSVERKLKECLRNDRARIQVGRISHFGLLEMSRQRLRTGMVEGSTSQCQHCQGTGVVRSTESVALSVLRGLEDWLRTNIPCNLNAVCATEVALYILNQKRSYLNDIEARHGVIVSVTASDRMHGANFYIEKVSVVAAVTGPASAAITQTDRIIQPFEAEQAESGEDARRGSRRKRRRRRGGREDGDNRESFARNVADDDAADAHDDDDAIEEVGGDAPREVHADAGREAGSDGGEEGGQRRRSRRRGRRGGRQHRNLRSDQPETNVRDDLNAPLAGFSESEDFAETYQVADEQPRLPVQDIWQPEPEQTQIVVRSEQPAERTPEASPQPASAPFPGADEQRPAYAANGAGKPNGIDHSKPVDEGSSKGLASDQGAEPELAQADAEDGPPPPPKPRGPKRGWWQRKE